MKKKRGKQLPEKAQIESITHLKIEEVWEVSEFFVSFDLVAGLGGF